MLCKLTYITPYTKTNANLYFLLFTLTLNDIFLLISINLLLIQIKK